MSSNRNIIYICVILVFTTIVIGIRTFNHSFVLDEAVYHFKSTYDIWENPYKSYDRIGSVNDVIDSQYEHYFTCNGRVVVHFIEQLFSGVLPFWLFCVFNSLLFVAFVIMLLRLTAIKPQRHIVLHLVLILGMLLLLFPECQRIWTSINYSPNYLLPSALMCAVLISRKQLLNNKILSNSSKLGIALIAFLCGWSNEAISLPLSGAFFVMMVYYVIKTGSLTGYKEYIIIIPLWLGTLLLLSAPGNWLRLHRAIDGSSKADTMTSVLHLLTEEHFFLILLVILLFLICFNRQFVGNVIRKNQLLFAIICFSLFLIIIVHTSARSMIAGELCSMMIILKILYKWLNRVKKSYTRYTTMLLTMSLGIQQSVLAYDTVKYHKMEKEVIDNYLKSQDGIVLLPDVDISWSSRPYIRFIKEENGLNEYGYMSTLQLMTGRKEPKFQLLKKSDFDAVTDSTFYTPKNRTNFDAPIYGGSGSWYWIHPDSVGNIKNPIAICALSDFDINTPILVWAKYTLNPNSIPVMELDIDTIHAQSGDFYRISLNDNFKYINIKNGR